MGLCSHARDRKRATGGEECADSSGTRESEGHRHVTCTFHSISRTALSFLNRNQIDGDTLSQQQQERNMAVPAAACWSSGRIPILYFLSNRSVFRRETISKWIAFYLERENQGKSLRLYYLTVFFLLFFCRNFSLSWEFLIRFVHHSP